MGYPEPRLPINPNRRNLLLAFAFLCLTGYTVLTLFGSFSFGSRPLASIPSKANELIAKCAAANEKPSVPPNFARRTKSDRFVPGTKPILIYNATIWTGKHNGHEVFHGDVLLSRGLIKRVGRNLLELADKEFGQALVVVDAKGKWVTPG